MSQESAFRAITRGPSGPRRWFFYAGLSLAALLSLGLCLFVFWPMSVRVADLEEQLQTTQKLIASSGMGYSDTLGGHLSEAEDKLATMRGLAGELTRQTRFSEEIQALLEAPFRVLEFEQRRFDIQQNLGDLAASQKSELPSDYMAGLPSYYTTSERQNLLWLHLEFFNHVMVALLRSGKDLRVLQVDSMPVRTHAGEGAVPWLYETQLRLSVEGPSSALATFLNASLPDGSEALSPIGKKAYCIERLDLRSLSEGPTGRVRLDIRLSGYVLNGGGL